MSMFLQLHLLTSYPASNLNRDDMGRPKTVIMGNAERLRVSSQSIKRAWRTSDVFNQAFEGSLGTRTKSLGQMVFFALTLGRPLGEVLQGKETPGPLPRLEEKKARDIARAVAGVFGAIKKEAKFESSDDAKKVDDKKMEELEIEQMAHLGPRELQAVAEEVEARRADGKVPEAKTLDLLRKPAMAVDIAMFGRMLAAEKRFNVEAAVQVAHAMSVHSVAVEEDFFTAVDDLNREDAGAGHLGVAEYGAGLFYLYVCIDRDLLVENLQGDATQAAAAVRALVTAACTVSPGGKQNSYASRASALYCLAEKSTARPGTLASAFLDPLNQQGNLLATAVDKLERERRKFVGVYGDDSPTVSFNVQAGSGSLADVCAFLAE